jgi:hypothetical protein
MRAIQLDNTSSGFAYTFFQSWLIFLKIPPGFLRKNDNYMLIASTVRQ